MTEQVFTNSDIFPFYSYNKVICLNLNISPFLIKTISFQPVIGASDSPVRFLLIIGISANAQTPYLDPQGYKSFVCMAIFRKRSHPMQAGKIKNRI